MCMILSGQHVPEASERINIVFTWVQQLLQDRKREGGMAEATSTLWSLLSGGYSQFEQCRCATQCRRVNLGVCSALHEGCCRDGTASILGQS